MQSLFNYCQVLGRDLLEVKFPVLVIYITALTCECHRFVESIVRVLGALRNYLGLLVVTEVRFVVQCGAGSRPSAGWVGSAHFVLLLVRPVITLIVDISCLRNRQPPPPTTPRDLPPTASDTL